MNRIVSDKIVNIKFDYRNLSKNVCLISSGAFPTKLKYRKYSVSNSFASRLNLNIFRIALFPTSNIHMYMMNIEQVTHIPLRTASFIKHPKYTKITFFFFINTIKVA